MGFFADLAGKRVAVIGTGASAIQFIPEIYKAAAQRHRVSAHAALGDAEVDYEFTPAHHRRFNLPFYRRLFRKHIFLVNELRALGFLGNKKVGAAAEAMARAHLERQIADRAARQTGAGLSARLQARADQQRLFSGAGRGRPPRW